MCGRLHIVACHGATAPLLMPAALAHAGPPLFFPLKSQLVVEFFIHVDVCRIELLGFLLRASRHTPQDVGDAIMYRRLTVTGSSWLLRRRDPHSQHRNHAAAEVILCGEHNNDLPLPAITGIAKGTAKRAIIGSVQHKTAGVVGKPNAELALSVSTHT